MKLLSKIQRELHAPKSQYNDYGKYAYRSCEDILAAVKPLLGEGCLTIMDAVEVIGNRVYIKATATLRDAAGAAISVSAYAREPDDKKGFDEAQITGASSSYARKYALNGLFAIDDIRDPDATNLGGDQVPPQKTGEKPKHRKSTAPDNTDDTDAVFAEMLAHEKLDPAAIGQYLSQLVESTKQSQRALMLRALSNPNKFAESFQAWQTSQTSPPIPE